MILERATRPMAGYRHSGLTAIMGAIAMFQTWTGVNIRELGFVEMIMSNEGVLTGILIVVGVGMAYFKQRAEEHMPSGIVSVKDRAEPSLYDDDDEPKADFGELS